jgi:hypothetical protein
MAKRSKADGQRAKTPTPAAQPCRHHWVIESAESPTSEGHCKLCGEVRDFRNASNVAWEKGLAAGDRTGIPPVIAPSPNEETDHSQPR